MFYSYFYETKNDGALNKRPINQSEKQNIK